LASLKQNSHHDYCCCPRWSKTPDLIDPLISPDCVRLPERIRLSLSTTRVLRPWRTTKTGRRETGDAAPVITLSSMRLNNGRDVSRSGYVRSSRQTVTIDFAMAGPPQWDRFSSHRAVRRNQWDALEPRIRTVVAESGVRRRVPYSLSTRYAQRRRDGTRASRWWCRGPAYPSEKVVIYYRTERLILSAGAVARRNISLLLSDSIERPTSQTRLRRVQGQHSCRTDPTSPLSPPQVQRLQGPR